MRGLFFEAVAGDCPTPFCFFICIPLVFIIRFTAHRIPLVCFLYVFLGAILIQNTAWPQVCLFIHVSLCGPEPFSFYTFFLFLSYLPRHCRGPGLVVYSRCVCDLVCFLRSLAVGEAAVRHGIRVCSFCELECLEVCTPSPTSRPRDIRTTTRHRCGTDVTPTRHGHKDMVL